MQVLEFTVALEEAGGNVKLLHKKNKCLLEGLHRIFSSNNIKTFLQNHDNNKQTINKIIIDINKKQNIVFLDATYNNELEECDFRKLSDRTT